MVLQPGELGGLQAVCFMASGSSQIVHSQISGYGVSAMALLKSCFLVEQC